MGSLNKCLLELKRKAGLDPQLEADLRDRISGFTQSAQRAGINPAVQGDLVIQIKAIEKRLAELARSRKLAELTAITHARNHRAAATNPKGYRTGVNEILQRADLRARVIEARLQSKLADFLSAGRTRGIGFTQDTALIEDVLRELHGTKTSNSDAAGFAKAWGEVAEDARQAYNDAGGDIAQRPDWGSPQFHDSKLVAKVSRDEWGRFIEPLLDRSKHLDANGMPLDDLEWRATLDEIYDAISTDGLSRIEPDKAFTGHTSLANKHRDHRFFVFKDGDSWLAYQKRFGKPDLFSGMTNHVRSMAREIALLESLGPNPKQAFNVLRTNILKRQPPVKGRDQLRLQFTDALWKVVSHESVQTPSSFIHEVFASARDTLVAAKLGTASISALADTALVKMAADFNGLPAFRVYRRALSLMNPANEADRVRAVRMMLGAEGMTGRNFTMRKIGEELAGHSRMSQLAEATLRASGLQTWTDNMRRAFSMEMMGQWGEHAGRAFDELPDQLRSAFKHWGVTAGEWDLLRQAPLTEFEERGAIASFMQPDNLAAHEVAGTSRKQRLEVAMKFQTMLLREMDFASPLPDAAARAVMTMGTERGTLWGEVASSFFLFKGFPITMMMLHAGRALKMATPGARGTYLAKLALLTTLGGAVALQAKQVIRGKTPRSMDEAQFWGAAMLQGGGAGILGDFLYTAGRSNRFGHGFFTSIGGPMVGLGNDAVALGAEAFGAVTGQENINFGREAVRFAEMYTPGSSLWYTRLALERLVLDQGRKMVDPQASKTHRATEKRIFQEYGQRFWWRPGRLSPSQ